MPQLPIGFAAVSDGFIHNLPPEILTEVFLHCWTYDTSTTHILASVCAGWRNLALQTTQLWSVVVLSDPKNRQLNLNDVKGASTWMRRSGTRPIHLTFMSFQSSYDGSLTETFLLDLIVEFASRLGKLEIYTELVNLFLALTNLHSVEFPILNSLTLHCFTNRWNLGSSPIPFPHTQFAILPSLTYLDLEQSVWTINEKYHVETIFPWKQLIDCSLSPADWDIYRWHPNVFFNSHFSSVINLAYNCKELNLYGVAIKLSEIHHGSPARVSYDDLQVLHIDTGSQSAVVILDHLRARSLETLNVLDLSRLGPEVGFNFTRSLLNFSASSAFPLTNLSLRGIILDPELTTQFLKGVPSLVDVKFVECELAWNPAFMESLIFRPEHPILPLLESFFIDDNFMARNFLPNQLYRGAPIATVLGFLESRRQRNLRSVVMRTGPNRIIEDEDERRRLKDLLAADWRIETGFVLEDG